MRLHFQEVSLSEVVKIIEEKGYNPEHVFIYYAGCGSHHVEVAYEPPLKLIPVEDDDGYDSEVGF